MLKEIIESNGFQYNQCAIDISKYLPHFKELGLMYSKNSIESPLIVNPVEQFGKYTTKD